MMYEVTYFDRYVGDDGFPTEGIRKDIVNQEKLEWYKKNTRVWSIKPIK